MCRNALDDGHKSGADKPCLVGLWVLEPGSVVQADLEGLPIGQESGNGCGTGNEGSRVGEGVIPAAPAVEHAFAILSA